MNPDFQDPGFGLVRFADRAWVACPECGNAALVAPGRLGHARLVCASCGFLSTDPIGMRLRTGLGVQGRFFSFPSRCDNCGRPHPVLTRRGAVHGRRLVGPIRCKGCGYVGRYALAPIHGQAAEGIDPWFGLPLFLSERVGSQTLWAFNAAHLALLEDYLGAGIRKRPADGSKMTMLARLPRWMKIRAGRDRALRAIVRLRRRALAAGIN